MTNRFRKACVLVVAIALAVDLIVVLVPRAYRKLLVARIDPKAVYDQIRLGDNLDRVESLFGLPPGDYSTDPRAFYEEFGNLYEARDRYPSERERSWQFDTCEVLVYLEQDGVIGAKTTHGIVPPSKSPTFLQRVCDLIQMALPF